MLGMSEGTESAEVIAMGDIYAASQHNQHNIDKVIDTFSMLLSGHLSFLNEAV